jgi:hypothetical protein
MTASSNNSSYLYDGGERENNIHTLQRNNDQVSQKAEPKERVYYADWVRAMAITLVIFIHALVNSADAANVNFEDDPTIKQKEDGIIKSLV